MSRSVKLIFYIVFVFHFENFNYSIMQHCHLCSPVKQQMKSVVPEARERTLEVTFSELVFL